MSDTKKVLKVYVHLEGRKEPRELALGRAEQFVEQIKAIDKLVESANLVVPTFITINDMPSGNTLKIATSKIIEIDIVYEA